jgi:hypothetical protein
MQGKQRWVNLPRFQTLVVLGTEAKVLHIELAQLPGLPQMSQAVAKILEKVFLRHTTSQGHIARPSICELRFATDAGGILAAGPALELLAETSELLWLALALTCSLPDPLA